MTKRSILAGMLAACAICGLTYFNNSVIHQTRLIGNYLPISVYGLLIIFVFLANPVLGRIKPSLRLSPKELAVILMCTLAACGIAGSGLLRGFTNTVMLPHYYSDANPSWKREGIIDMIPGRMLADRGENDEAMIGFLRGAPSGKSMELSNVPWRDWARPLTTWGPIVALLILSAIGLSLFVHRQWSQHEHLPYPISDFASELLGKEDECRPAILKQRLFWIGAGIVFGIHLWNYLQAWNPDYLPRIPTKFDFRSLIELLPCMNHARIAWSVSQCRIFFAVIGFAYLISSEVSLSFAFGPLVYTMVEGVLLYYGITLNDDIGTGVNPSTSLNAGSFFGLALMILYCGRYYYYRVTRRALYLSADQEDEDAAWGMRMAIVGMAGTTLLFTLSGISFPFAVIYTLGLAVMYVCTSRLVAETGLFFLKPQWAPHIILMGIFGLRAMGPAAIVALAFCSWVLHAEPREMVMPFVVNSLKLADDKGLHLPRLAGWAFAATVLALVVGVGSTLFFQYRHGTDFTDRWTTQRVPTFALTTGSAVQRRLQAQGVERGDTGTNLGRFKPNARFVLWFVIGMALVVVTYIARLRIRGWPVHPAVFLVASWGPGALFAYSFLIGWLIKALVQKYAHWKMVQQLKPLMFGLIAGEMLGGVVPALISTVYYFMTGEQPVNYSFMP